MMSDLIPFLFFDWISDRYRMSILNEFSPHEQVTSSLADSGLSATANMVCFLFFFKP